MDDLISRQSVNDAMDRTCDLVCEYSKEQRYTMCGACPLGCAFDAVADLPSAQPDLPEWVQKVDRRHREALSNPHIIKPLAWALYEVWKEVDKNG